MRQHYQWPDQYRSAVVFSIDVDAESPYVWSCRNTPKLTLGELEQRRFGPRQGIWRLFDLLAEFGIKGSFFVPGWVAETYPDLLPAIAERGHEIGAHGHYHELVHELSGEQNSNLLDRQIEVFRRQIGKAPEGYRSPAWELTPSMHELLRKKGFFYDTSLMGYDHPYSLDGLVEVPVEWMLDDGLYFRFVNAPTDKGRPADPAAVLNGWIEEFEATRENGSLFVVTVHDWISGRGQRIRMLRSLLAHICNSDGTWITSAGDVARYHAASRNYATFETQLRLADLQLKI